MSEGMTFEELANWEFDKALWPVGEVFLHSWMGDTQRSYFFTKIYHPAVLSDAAERAFR
jgi:hypothetical protein